MLEEEPLEEEFQSSLGRKLRGKKGRSYTLFPVLFYRDKKMKSHDETSRIGFEVYFAVTSVHIVYYSHL